jgi:predicted dienelactone hydrolase
LYYPTQSAARTMAMGPFNVNVAIQAAPEAKVKGLIVLSHGTGGTELGHSSLAEALAQNGYWWPHCATPATTGRIAPCVRPAWSAIRPRGRSRLRA